jgi:hypothetical protein
MSKNPCPPLKTLVLEGQSFMFTFAKASVNDVENSGIEPGRIFSPPTYVNFPKNFTKPITMNYRF